MQLAILHRWSWRKNTNVISLQFDRRISTLKVSTTFTFRPTTNAQGQNWPEGISKNKPTFPMAAISWFPFHKWTAKNTGVAKLLASLFLSLATYMVVLASLEVARATPPIYLVPSPSIIFLKFYSYNAHQGWTKCWSSITNSKWHYRLIENYKRI